MGWLAYSLMLPNQSLPQPFVPDDSVGIEDYLGRRESDIYLYPNPTSGEAVVCGYMYGYTGIELYDLQGRKLGDLVERGVSVVRKAIKN